MKIRTIGSTIDGSHYNCAASYLINDSIVLDAGVIGLADIATQRQVTSILLSHCHLDHVGSLPLLIDNVYQPGPECVRVYGSQHTLDALNNSLFNDVVWPDVVRLSGEESPFLEFVTLYAEQPLVIEGLTITPIQLDHVVPTLGFLIDDGQSAVAFVSDTGPTQRVWEVLANCPRLKCLFLECAFPNRMQWLAEKAQHLTPSMFAAEVAKLDRDIPIIAIHVKPGFHDEVWSELQHVPRVIPSSPNHDFEF